MAEDDQVSVWDRAISADPTSRGLQTTYLIISQVAAVGCGLLLIYLVYRKEYLQKPCNYLRCSLATYDIIFMCCLVPMEIYVLFQNDDSQAACWLQGLRFLVTAMGGTFLLMAIELYYFVCHPLHYHEKVTTKRVVVGVLVIKGLSLLNGAVYIILKRLNADSTSQCGSFYLDDSTGPATATKNIMKGLNVLAMLIIFLPFCLIVIPYFLIFKEARKQQERDENRSLWLYQTRAFKKLAPHAINLAVWVGIFVFMTVLTSQISRAKQEAILPLLITRRIAVLLYTTLSSLVNPLVYSFRMPDFRKALRETLGRPSNAPVVLAPTHDDRQRQDLEMAVFSVTDNGRGGSVIEVTEAPPSARLNQMGEDSSMATNTRGAGRASKMMQAEDTLSTLSLKPTDIQSDQRTRPSEKGKKAASAPPKHPHTFTVQAEVHRDPIPPPDDHGQDMANTPPIQHHSFPVPARPTEQRREESKSPVPHDYLDTICLQDNDIPDQHGPDLLVTDKPTPKMAWHKDM